MPMRLLRWLLLLLIPIGLVTAASTPTITTATPSFSSSGLSLAIQGGDFAEGVPSHHDGAMAYGGHEYLAIATPMTWLGAKADCEARGGYLATVTSDAERDFIHDLTTTDYWIGMSDFAVTGDFRWVDGEPVVYTRWSASEPNNLGQEHAVEMYRDWGQWNNLSDSVPLPYVCEFSSPPTVALRRAGQTDVVSVRVDLASATALTALFAPQPLPAGAYDVVVTNGDGGSATLVGGFVMPQAAPIAPDAAFAVAPSGTVAFTLPGFDPNGDALTFSAVAPPVGTFHLLDASTGSCSFTAPAGIGSVAITYRASDGTATSGVGTVTIAWGLQPLPGGAFTRLLHLGAAEDDGSSAVLPSGGAVMWDHFIYAGLGPEQLQQPTPGLAEDMGVSMTSSPLVWTALEDDDGTWAGNMPAQTVGYSGIYLFSDISRTMRIELGGNSADRVWLDGQPTPIVDGGGGIGTVSDSFALGAGVHVLVIKDYTGPGPSGAMRLRLRDEAGADITGLSYALVDIIHPTVVSQWPQAGESGISRLADIQLTFSEPMDTAVDPATVATLSGGAADGVWSWGDRFRLCWTPHAPLDAGTRYTVEIHRAMARDPAGNVFAGRASFSFTTGAEAIPLAPAPSTLTPSAVHRGAVVGLELDGGGFATGPIAHPPGVSEFQGHFYRWYPKQEWFAAESALEAQGGHLATISSADEDAFVWQLGGRINGFIGARDPTQTLEQWTWVTGEPFTYTNWAPGEPNSFGGEVEDIGIYWWGLQWNDVGDGERPYVGEFERPLAPAVLMRRAGQADRSLPVLAATATRLDLSCDARGAATGAWDVVVTNPGGASATLPGALTVLNDAPVAQPLSMHAHAGTPRHGALTATDANGDPLTFAAVALPSHGALALDASGTFTYTADPGYVGPDGFSFTASDGEATSAPAAATIAVEVSRPSFEICAPTTAGSYRTVVGNDHGGHLVCAGHCPAGATVTWSATGAVNATGTAAVSPVYGSGGIWDWSFSFVVANGTTTVSVTSSASGGGSDTAAVTVICGGGPWVIPYPPPPTSAWPYWWPYSDGVYATAHDGSLGYGVTSAGSYPTSATFTEAGATTASGSLTPTGDQVALAPLAPGLTTITIDLSGGGSDEIALAVLKDDDPPDITLLAPSLTTSPGVAITISGTAYDADDRVVAIGVSDAPGGPSSGWTMAAGTPDAWSFAWSSTALGDHLLYVHAIDRAGNIADLPLTISVVGGGTTTGGTTTSGTTTSGTTTSGTTTSGTTTSGTATSGTTTSGTTTPGTTTSGTTTSGTTTSGTATGGASTTGSGAPTYTPETGGSACGLGGGGVAVVMALLFAARRRR